jgi:hypothetical protein
VLNLWNCACNKLCYCMFSAEWCMHNWLLGAWFRCHGTIKTLHIAVSCLFESSWPVCVCGLVACVHNHSCFQHFLVMWYCAPVVYLLCCCCYGLLHQILPIFSQCVHALSLSVCVHVYLCVSMFTCGSFCMVGLVWLVGTNIYLCVRVYPCLPLCVSMFVWCVYQWVPIFICVCIHAYLCVCPCLCGVFISGYQYLFVCVSMLTSLLCFYAVDLV